MSASLILAEPACPSNAPAPGPNGLVSRVDIATLLPDTELPLVERMRMLPHDLLWTLLFVGGELEELDVLVGRLVVPIEELAQSDGVPTIVQEAICRGDRAVQRRFTLALMIRWQLWGNGSREIFLGAIFTNAVMGVIGRQLPTIRDELYRQLGRSIEGRAVAARLLGPAVSAVEKEEDTSRYFRALDPWWVKLVRWLWQLRPRS